MTPKHLRQSLVNAYEGHDRVEFTRLLDLMEGMFRYTGPTPTEPKPERRPHGTTDGDLCPECGWTCNVCACESPAWRKEALDLREPVHAHPLQSVKQCTRGEACACRVPGQREVCMYRRPA